jgi:hypothetical protein
MVQGQEINVEGRKYTHGPSIRSLDKPSNFLKSILKKIGRTSEKYKISREMIVYFLSVFTETATDIQDDSLAVSHDTVFLS